MVCKCLEAFNWFKISAEQGMAFGMINVASFLRLGTGVEQDLKEAFKQAYSTEFTDDARVVEALGIYINLVEGSYKNIKINIK